MHFVLFCCTWQYCKSSFQQWAKMTYALLCGQCTEFSSSHARKMGFAFSHCGRWETGCQWILHLYLFIIFLSLSYWACTREPSQCPLVYMWFAHHHPSLGAEWAKTIVSVQGRAGHKWWRTVVQVAQQSYHWGTAKNLFQSHLVWAHLDLPVKNNSKPNGSQLAPSSNATWNASHCSISPMHPWHLDSGLMSWRLLKVYVSDAIKCHVTRKERKLQFMYCLSEYR